MRVLLYGHNGWIGNQVVELLKKESESECEYKVILGKSRVNNKKDIEEEILKENPTHIMSFIGRTHGKIYDKEYTTIDYLEQEGKLVENVRDNLFSPIVLALLCKKYNIHFTYLGTGCIFKFDDEHSLEDGLENKNGFSEDSLPNFFGSSYSVVKGFADELMHMLEENSLNVRIRMPITGETNPRNFITKITTYKKICSIPNSMTVLPDLLPIMIDMAKNKITGTVNLTNPGLISHNEILEMYTKYVDNNFKWENFSAEEQRKILAADRSNNFLNTTKLQILYPNVKNIKDSIKDLMMNYKL
jgi:3,5-epimerase/4-reductase